MALTDVKVKNAKGQDKPYKLTDSEGLYLFVTPAGSKVWRLKYRFEGKEKTLVFGKYPLIGLSEARQKRDAAKRLLLEGIDPQEQKKARRRKEQQVAENTFEAVAREWHQQFEKTWTEDHAQRIWRRLEVDVLPWLGSKGVGEIMAPEILAVLRRIQPRSLEMAHRVKIACGQVFRYAIATGRSLRNPVADLQGALPPVKHTHFAALIEPEKVAPLLVAMDGYSGSQVVRCALQLAPLVFLRPGELRAGEWAEINFMRAEWTIPAERMKTREPHLVPLSRQALEILQRLHPLTGHGRFIFPSMRSPLRCMSEMAVNAALRRMGFDKTEITGHGFRAMARTILDEVLEFPAEIIEHQLAHAVKDPLGRAYNRTTKLPQRKVMMQAWADYLDGLKETILLSRQGGT